MGKAPKSKFSKNRHGEKRFRIVLGTNMKGFLCSCNNREKNCVGESYNLLNKYADILYPQLATTESGKMEDEGDVASDLKKEILELKSGKEHRRFHVVDSGAKNIIFIKTKLDDPLPLAEKIVSDIAETKVRQTKILLRLVPIQVTCKAYVKDIENAVKEIAAKYFTDHPKTFSIVFNHRNNNQLKRDEVIKAVADVVFKIRDDHKVDLKDAEISIVVEVIKGIALIGVVPNFIKYKKYNLHAIAEPVTETESSQKEKNEDPQ